MGFDTNKNAVDEILRSIQYMIDQSLQHQTQIYNGLLISNSGNKWNVQVNGENYTLSQYGNVSTPAVGKIVKVIIPNGNMSLAFFI